MFNRIIKQALHRTTPGYIRQVVSIMENRKIALDEVEHRFYKPRKARNTVETLVKDRQKARIRRRISYWTAIRFAKAGKIKRFPLAE